MLAVPLPLILLALIRKIPVLEKLNDWEKRRQLWMWRVQTNVGWLVLFSIHLFIIYWLTIFSNNFSMEVFMKWGNAAVQSLFHRFVSAPVLRGGVFAIILIVGKQFSSMDHLLVFFPHIMPTDKLAGKPEQPPEIEQDEGGLAESSDGDDVVDDQALEEEEDDAGDDDMAGDFADFS